MTNVPSVGMPILSGPPPVIESSSCRQCGKDFIPLIRRARTCGHCGYQYCHQCMSDGQALMPRRRGSNNEKNSSSSSASATAAGALAEIKDAFGFGSGSAMASEGGDGGKMDGYEVEQVCLHCLGMLQVTAAPVEMLRSLPIKRLKDYLAAYDIQCIGPKEKEDFVQAVIKARNPTTGCLYPEKESFYRRKSVPKFGQSASQTSNSTSTSNSRHGAGVPPPQNSARFPFNLNPNNLSSTFNFNSNSSSRSSAAPDSRSQARPPTQETNYNARSAPTGGPTAYTQTQTRARPAPPSQRENNNPQQPAQSRPTSARPTPVRPTSVAAAAAPAPPPPPVPTILSLVSLPKSYLSSLSIGTLKAILYDNHVRVDYAQVLEKNELISRVSELIDDERRRLERQRIEEERQAQADAAAAARRPISPLINGTTSVSATTAETEPGKESGSNEQSRDQDHQDKKDEESNNESQRQEQNEVKEVRNLPTGPAPDIDRGLCVVCQDEEATLAVVDCGHLAMCAHCSDLVMATTRECPLCRTRIVTPQRLIRIYRV